MKPDALDLRQNADRWASEICSELFWTTDVRGQIVDPGSLTVSPSFRIATITLSLMPTIAVGFVGYILGFLGYGLGFLG